MWSLIIQHQDWTFVIVHWLNDNKITDDSIKIILAVKWPNMKKLYLRIIILLIIDDNLLTKQGAKNILEHKWDYLTLIALGIDLYLS